MTLYSKAYPEKKDAPITVTIADSGTVSDAVELGSLTPVAVQLPASMTGTLFYVQVSIDGGTTFKRLTDQDGTDKSYTVTSDKIYHLDPADYIGVDQVKIESNAAESGAKDVKIKAVLV